MTRFLLPRNNRKGTETSTRQLCEMRYNLEADRTPKCKPHGAPVGLIFRLERFVAILSATHEQIFAGYHGVIETSQSV